MSDPGLTTAMFTLAGTLGLGLITARGTRRADSRADFDSLQKAIQEQLDDQREISRELQMRVKTLEAESLAQSVWRTLATPYIHQLRDALRRAGVDVPDVPEGLDL